MPAPKSTNKSSSHENAATCNSFLTPLLKYALQILPQLELGRHYIQGHLRGATRTSRGCAHLSSLLGPEDLSLLSLDTKEARKCTQMAISQQGRKALRLAVLAILVVLFIGNGEFSTIPSQSLVAVPNAIRCIVQKFHAEIVLLFHKMK